MNKRAHINWTLEYDGWTQLSGIPYGHGVIQELYGINHCNKWNVISLFFWHYTVWILPRQIFGNEL